MQDYPAIVIATPGLGYELELLPAFGGIANRLTHVDAEGRRTELLAGCASRAALEQDRYFRGVPLYPYVNRLDAGRYRYQGRDYQFAINEPAYNTSLHGFLTSIIPEVKVLTTHGGDAGVQLLYRYQGENAAYPFPAEITLHYHLHPVRGLTVRFEVHNLHYEPVPVGIGWHPYYTLGQSVDELMLKLPAVRKVEVDARLLPTGKKTLFADFANGAALAGYQLNDCMALLPAQTDKVSCLLWSPSKGIGIEVWQTAADYPYLQVFIPPDRQSLAIEPVSCGINAFNTREKLCLLAPGQVFSATNGVRLMATE